jgi:hypothetical protein
VGARGKEEKYARTHLVHHRRSPSLGVAARVALQRRLGLLSERWFGTDRNYHLNLVAIEGNLVHSY